MWPSYTSVWVSETIYLSSVCSFWDDRVWKTEHENPWTFYLVLAFSFFFNCILPAAPLQQTVVCRGRSITRHSARDVVNFVFSLIQEIVIESVLFADTAVALHFGFECQCSLQELLISRVKIHENWSHRQDESRANILGSWDNPTVSR